MTDIGPGTMVECIRSATPNGNFIGRKAMVLKVHETDRCSLDHGPCGGLILLNWPCTTSTVGWAQCCFKPIDSDKEIEKQKFEELKPLMVPEHLVRLARG